MTDDHVAARIADLDEASAELVQDVLPLGDLAERRRSECKALGVQVRQLLVERRHDEALDLLTEARKARPHEPRLSHAIRALKERMLLEYVQQLRSLDRVPHSTLRPGPRLLDDMSVEARIVLQLVDGIMSFEDIMEVSSLGRLRTAQALVRLLDDGVLTSIEPDAGVIPSLPVDPDPVAETPDSVFRQATAAYLKRDLPRAERLFERCLQLDPNHKRARHNLRAVQSRLQEIQ